MTTNGSVGIVNINEFRADLRRSETATPRDLTKALKAVGAKLVPKIEARVPTGSAKNDRHPGLLARSYSASVRGTTGNIVSRAPYGGGAEWGQRGKWSGFNRYGGPGRFAARTIDEQADAIVEDIAAGLRDVITLNGWAT